MTSSDAETWGRRRGAFGAAAAEYAEHRPDYAPAAITWALAGADGPVHHVLDLAAGTGTLTAGLTAYAVTAVEADPEMLAELGRRLPDVRRVVGRAEAIPLADDSVDTVVVGTAWHWFDADLARAEIARVLRPGGVLAIFYALPDSQVAWVVAAHKLARTSASTPEPPDPEAPFDIAGWEAWQVTEKRFPHVHRRTADTLVATFGTHSHTLVVSPEEREATLARLHKFLRLLPATRRGEFDYPLVTLAVRARPSG